MRKGKPLVLDENDTRGPKYDGSFEWNASGEEVLRSIDNALKAHGLEIVEHETYGSFHAFSIEKYNRKSCK